jgi:hypothetical protein
MFVGAGIAHNWFLAAAPDKTVDGAIVVGGPGPYGQIAVVTGIVFCVILGLAARSGKTKYSTTATKHRIS